MKTTGLNFIEAVQAANAGYGVRRAAWSAKSYVYAADDHLQYTDGKCVSTVQPFLENLLAEDWEIVIEPPKTMTFAEMLGELRQMKKVRRL